MFRLSPIQFKRCFELGNQELTFGDFIGLAFVTALVTMAFPYEEATKVVKVQ